MHRIWVGGDSLNIVNELKKLNGVGRNYLMEDFRNTLRKAVRSSLLECLTFSGKRMEALIG